LIDYFSDKSLEIDGDIVTTGRDAIVTHPFGNLEGIIGTKPTKRFSGESSEFIRTQPRFPIGRNGGVIADG
jgi:hypothetical protein